MKVKIGTSDLLGILFIALKLIGHIDWNWWLVLAPFWVSISISVANYWWEGPHDKGTSKKRKSFQERIDEEMEAKEGSKMTLEDVAKEIHQLKVMAAQNNQYELAAKLRTLAWEISPPDRKDKHA